MEKYPEKVVLDLREIHKSILERITHTGEIEESDILFMKLYKAEFEQLACKILLGEK
jgi:hypothetical protein